MLMLTTTKPIWSSLAGMREQQRHTDCERASKLHWADLLWRERTAERSLAIEVNHPLFVDISRGKAKHLPVYMLNNAFHIYVIM